MTTHDYVLTSHTGRKFSGDVRFQEDGKKKPIILFIHGFKGFKDWGHFNLIANFFAENGFVYAKLNFSHNGTTLEYPVDFADLEAFGRNTFSKELDDIDVMIDHLLSEKSNIPDGELDHDRLFLMGHSRGGGVALLKTAEDKRVKKVATLAAIHDLEKRWPTSFIQEWKEKGVQYVYNGRTQQNMPLYYDLVEDFYANPSRFNIPENVKNIQVPMLLTHGTEDETLPVDMVHALASLNPLAQKYVVEGANHVFGASHPYTENILPEHTKMVVESIRDFFF